MFSANRTDKIDSTPPGYNESTNIVPLGSVEVVSPSNYRRGSAHYGNGIPRETSDVSPPSSSRIRASTYMNNGISADSAGLPSASGAGVRTSMYYDNTINTDELINRSFILHGIRLQRPALSCSVSAVAIPRSSNDTHISVRKTRKADICTESTKIAYESTLIENGLTSSSARFCCPWANAYPAIQEKYNNLKKKSLLVTAQYRYPRRIIETDFDSLEPAPSFVAAVNEALLYDSKKKQIGALKGVLDKWGHVIPTYVELGSSLTATYELTSRTSPAEERKTESAVKLALGVKLGWNADLTGSLAYIAEQLQIVTLGGASAFGGADWNEAIEGPDRWDIIRVDDVRPTLDLLRKSHQKLYAKLRPLWGAIAVPLPS